MLSDAWNTGDEGACLEAGGQSSVHQSSGVYHEVSAMAPMRLVSGLKLWSVEA
ncbi:hypothetical protein DY000_02056318 [Brassica cretica]|uniref:Uncharacterized protein n=1 Tax=Brassica cretica TaxID=69181 RepID=A0ABQ7AIH2_BRACR|nr:hypothetical protein DY000_02056318 [Brassica cretica]